MNDEVNDRPTHIDLFSGIGGFALAARWAGFETVVFCEKDEFCQKVLKERFGAVADTEYMRKLQSKGGEQEIGGWTSNGTPIIPDIRDFNGTEWQGATLLTGGFPCQPFSVAGQRRGKDDDRYLWPEMLRVIKEARPNFVLAENVTGIVRMELDQVLTDLEGAGYTTGTAIIPACAKNAPHRRDRVWIIAYDGISQPMELSRGKQKRRDGTRNGGQGDAPDSERGQSRESSEQKGGQDISGGNKDAPDSTTQGLSESKADKLGESLLYAQRDNREPPDSIGQYDDNGRYGTGKNSGKLKETSDISGSSWQIPWIEISTRFCRVDARVSNRVHRLKALGNAIVPQIAFEIIKSIKIIEEQ